MMLGVIADDFTGATDVASMLVGAGMRTVQTIGAPQPPLPDADAVVVALKTRTVAPADAVAQSLAALDALRGGGARRLYFKICSTFDSTPQGNIGPVADALLDALGAGFTIACPALPDNGRTVYRGHLFVGDALLSESGMQNHPLTPMTDANLVRVLQPQTRRRVGLLRHDTIARGAAALRDAFAALRSDGVGIAIADAISNRDLDTLAEAAADLPLVVAGSGVARGLPAAYAARGWLVPDARAAELPSLDGPGAVLAGSCSRATEGQVAHWLAGGRPALRLDPLAIARGEPVVDRALDWARGHVEREPVLVYATAAPADVRAVQRELGIERAGRLVEDALAAIARGVVAAGVRRLVVAGGETAGAVVQALGVRALRIGAPIDPGVPWTQVEGRPLQLALKSGNFGAVDFFSKALAR